MTLNNLSTVFGPNLLSPGGNELKMDVVTPVSVVLFFLNCPEEYFDESLYSQSDLSTSTSSSNKSRNTGGRGSFAERRDSNSGVVIPLRRVATDELDFPHGSPARPVIRRSRRGGSNKLISAIKNELKHQSPSRKESAV